MLKDVRKETEGDAITEKQLRDDKMIMSNAVIVEKAMDNADKGINGMKHRVDEKDGPVHLWIIL